MSKKLKKKIEEICGLVDLDWEERQRRANQILSSTEWKHKLCNDLVGLSFRELEQTLTGIANERRKKEDSYDKKLKLYNSKADRSDESFKSKSLRGSSPRTATHNVPTRTKSTRSLAQILAQVFAPRESETNVARESDDVLLAFYRGRIF